MLNLASLVIGIVALVFAVVAAGAVLLHFTRFGANVYALGGSRTTTALMGIPIGSMTVRIYMLSSVLAGLDCPFTIHQPDELRASVRALAERLKTSAV